MSQTARKFELRDPSLHELAFTRFVRQTSPMTVSRLRIAKSETRDFAERDRVALSRSRSWDSPVEWRMSNATFFGVFVAILAVLAVIALLAR